MSCRKIYIRKSAPKRNPRSDSDNFDKTWPIKNTTKKCVIFSIMIYGMKSWLFSRFGRTCSDHTLYFEIAYLVVFLAVHRRWTLAATPPFTRIVHIEFEFETVPGFSFIPVPGFSFVPLILVIWRKTEYPEAIAHQTHGIWPVNVQVRQ